MRLEGAPRRGAARRRGRGHPDQVRGHATTTACARCTSCCAAGTREERRVLARLDGETRTDAGGHPQAARSVPQEEPRAGRGHRRGQGQRPAHRPQVGSERGDHGRPARRRRARGAPPRRARAGSATRWSTRSRGGSTATPPASRARSASAFVGGREAADRRRRAAPRPDALRGVRRASGAGAHAGHAARPAADDAQGGRRRAARAHGGDARRGREGDRALRARGRRDRPRPRGSRLARLGAGSSRTSPTTSRRRHGMQSAAEDATSRSARARNRAHGRIGAGARRRAAAS